MPPGCAAGPWQAAVACNWPAAHARPLRSLFKSHYARPRYGMLPGSFLLSLLPVQAEAEGCKKV